MASTDENELLESLYIPLRDANLMKVGDWDSVSNKHSLAMSMRRLNSTKSHKGIVDFFPETYAMVRNVDRPFRRTPSPLYATSP